MWVQANILEFYLSIIFKKIFGSAIYGAGGGFYVKTTYLALI